MLRQAQGGPQQPRGATHEHLPLGRLPPVSYTHLDVYKRQDQEKWKGGWTLKRNGRLALKGGGRLHRLSMIFANPKMPGVDDYYEPWTYDYETLLLSLIHI